MSPSRSFESTLRVDYVVFYTFLAVSPSSLGWGSRADFALRTDIFRWVIPCGLYFVSSLPSPDLPLV